MALFCIFRCPITISFSDTIVSCFKYLCRALDIDIVDNNNEEEVNVNESVLAALEEVRESLSQGKSLKDIMHTMFGSTSGSQADSSSLTSPSAATEEDTEDVQVCAAFDMQIFQRRFVS